ncbi:MAG: radical SAM protein [Candidatus Thorarchaeota archaeon]
MRNTKPKFLENKIKMKYIYGPVPSRRLGNSLGIDPIPSKTCNYQCIYCQLGRTTNFTNIRCNYFPKDQIIAELEKAIELHEKSMDYITFVGSGEPTLYKDLKDLMLKVKELSTKPICVITNGSLLNHKEIQETLMLSDLVLPSLDAGDKKTFIKINRPHPSLEFKKIIQGLKSFKKIYNGQFWIEVMLVRGINDSKQDLVKIKEKIDLINPDKIDINVPIRPPMEKWVKIPDKNTLSILNEIFVDYSNINFPEKGKFRTYSSNFEKELISILERHPMREEQIIETFSSPTFSKNEIISQLKRLKFQKKIKDICYNNQIFWKLDMDKNKANN